MLPVYGILWSIGAYFWAVLYFAAYQFLYGQRRFLVLFVPFIGTVLTLLLATPVASDLRYAYPLIPVSYTHLQKLHFVSPWVRSTFSYSSHFVS